MEVFIRVQCLSDAFPDKILKLRVRDLIALDLILYRKRVSLAVIVQAGVFRGVSCHLQGVRSHLLFENFRVFLRPRVYLAFIPVKYTAEHIRAALLLIKYGLQFALQFLTVDLISVEGEISAKILVFFFCDNDLGVRILVLYKILRRLDRHSIDIFAIHDRSLEKTAVIALTVKPVSVISTHSQDGRDSVHRRKPEQNVLFRRTSASSSRIYHTSCLLYVNRDLYYHDSITA